MEIYVKANDSKLTIVYVNFCIGDYVHVSDIGHQYTSYTRAFKYFWGDTPNVDLHNVVKTDNLWKIINMTAHGSNYNNILCHIRNRKGDNAVIGIDGLKLSNFHKRNRRPIKPIIIYQLPNIGNVTTHDWHEKLWDFYYKNGEIIKKINY